jgi:general secretion pathway protein G
MKKQKAFTLIELLVVATIMVLLASVASVAYTQFGKQSRDARRKADLEQVRAALEMFRSNEDAYPAAIPNIGTSLCDPSGCVNGIYLQKVPADPRSPYVYYYAGAAADYTIGAYLEGGGVTCVAGQCGGNCNYCLGPYGQK